ncbi:ABC transporter permease [Streptomyces sp. AF1A]|jgi:ribose transport system permease protein|uniref:ABC transporter permease n=1 Tax=Streptomyces sp. AF1A TaxID=3394350 RepID=UPI0039BD8E39
MTSSLTPAGDTATPDTHHRPRSLRLPGGRSEPLSDFLTRVTLLGLLGLLVVLFSLLRPDTFATWGNAKTVLDLQAVLTILAIGLLLPLIVGELDLSVAANLGVGLILVTGLTSKQHLSLPLAALLAVLACTLVGAVNGLLITRLGINSFITTIGMSTVLTGVLGAYTNGNVFYEGIPSSLTKLGQGDLLGVPLPVVYAAALGVVVWYVLQWTPLGRYLYAIGGSPDAARLSGVPVRRLTLLAFTGAGLLAGVAGLVQAAVLGSGNPTVGPPMLLPAYAAVFLGATAIQPGLFNVWGTVIAVITLQVGTTGLSLLGAPFWIEPIFNGAALVLAVAATRLLRRGAR